MRWDNKGKQPVSCLTINGRLDFERTVFRNQDRQSVIPMDILLGIDQSRYSPGVCEICCRESLNNAFVPASENIERLAQIKLSSTTVRKIVEHRGDMVSKDMHSSKLGPDFTVEDCTDKTLIAGTDGVMVPLVTEEQKCKRRKTEAKKRREKGLGSSSRIGRPRKGSDGAYKEFKTVAFYDKDKSHQYVVGTSGDHNVAGRLIRRTGCQLRISEAEQSYSVSDGANWILNQYNKQLPMLDENILDFYHFQEHITTVSHVLYGEATEAAIEWKKLMTDTAKKHGSLVMLDKLSETAGRFRNPEKRKALEQLRQYVAKRIDMTDYPRFIEEGYDIGSGPTESFCKQLTQRLKGSGMSWDRDNAQAIMALAALYHSGLWDKHWKLKNKAA